MKKDTQILDTPLDFLEIYRSCSEGGAGAVNIFIGTVRNQTNAKEVVRLEYEAYDSMAIKEISKIIEKAAEKWPILHTIIHHRTGVLSVGEEAVVIAVSTPHRKDSFEACHFLIDALKKTVPIWKKEVFIDGEEWVSPNP
jgi:molybdopterin synthase catalytic subunit